MRHPLWQEHGVKVLDLDWAGEENATRYPSRMAENIAWHNGASPGQLLKQSHDVHLLNSF